MSKQKDTLDDLLTMQQTQDELQLSRGMIYKLIDKGTLKRVKAGWSTLFRREEVRRLKEERASYNSE